MLPREEAVLVRVFIGETDRHGGRPLYRAIVEEAYRRGLAGATVLHGPIGYGQGCRIHTQLNVDAAENLPMVVEIADTEERIHAFLPHLDALIGSGLITLEKIRMMRCGRLTRPLETPGESGA
jgi:PII-like signaling protein